MMTALPVVCRSQVTWRHTQCGDPVSFAYPGNPWLQDSANGGINAAGVGGSSLGGSAGGAPAHKLNLLPVSGNCHLPFSGSAPIACCQWKQAQHLCLRSVLHASGLLAHQSSALCFCLPLCQLLLMPADGTVKDSYVKQSANGGKVDVDNGDATCIAPVTVYNPVLCLVHVGAMIVLPQLCFQARCLHC